MKKSTLFLGFLVLSPFMAYAHYKCCPLDSKALCNNDVCCPEECTSEGACCRDGKKFNGQRWSYNPKECGCPYAGSYNKEKGACCKNGYRWDPYGKFTSDDGYHFVDIDTCGCPEGGTLRDNICCQLGEGEPGYRWNGRDGYTIREKKCDICPEDRDGNFGRLHPINHGEVCCFNGQHFKPEDKAYTGGECPANCECPEAKEGGCCSGGYRWDCGDKKYSWYMPEECGCPANKAGKAGTLINGNCYIGTMVYNPKTGKYEDRSTNTQTTNAQEGTT